MACVATCVLVGGCFDPSRVVEFKLYPSPIMGHVSLDQNVSGLESYSFDSDVQRLLSQARRVYLPVGCKGCWLATMKLDNGREYRVRLDRFRFWFHVQGNGHYRFSGDAKEAFKEMTRGGENWILQNNYRRQLENQRREVEKNQRE